MSWMEYNWTVLKVNVDNIFAHNVTLSVINDNEDQEPKCVYDCRQRNDWS